MKNRPEKYLAIIFLINGLLWLKSGWGKVSSNQFLDGLAGTLTKFASNNPYVWYKNLLINLALPNALWLGLAVEMGELFSGIILLISGLVILGKRKVTPLFKMVLQLGFLVAIILNGSFWLASGWTSGSTDSLNLLMLALELVGLVYWWRP